MCGIVAIFEVHHESAELRAQALEMVKKVRHRGPDWSGIYCDDQAILAHERLAIVDPQSGRQPLYSDDGNIVLAVNGEIYNHRDLAAKYCPEYDFSTASDCEVIIPLYQKMGTGLLNVLNGIFAFALYDKKNNNTLIGRDHMGIIPLYHGHDPEGHYYVASELKALEGVCNQFAEFPPGHYRLGTKADPVRWYERDWMSYDAVHDNVSSTVELRKALEDAVHRQLMSDVPYGVLLSGGLISDICHCEEVRRQARRIR
jgi:asparagine synthase (glutamine-hydrolysing)